MNDINHLDPNDEGLKAIMGDKFQDVTQAPQKPKPKKVTADTTTSAKQAQETTDKLMEAKWCPAKPKFNWLDNLRECAKWTGLYATLSILIFYWSSNDLMDSSIAIPCNWVCLLLTGYSVGKYFSRGMK